jgi:hypothetical protein
MSQDNPKTTNAEEIPEARWTALKARFKKADTRGRYEEKELPIQEYCKCMDMPDDRTKDQPFGIPITPDLAITLISDFFYLLDHPHGKPRLDGELSPIGKKFFEGRDIQAHDFTDVDIESFIQAVNSLVNVLRRSCAITIEKNVLLKTLSQPGCEGLRFYLCKKNVNSTDYMSLVTVGVDDKGHDLLYKYIKYPPDSPGPIADAVTPHSLVSEYSHPPGSGIIEDTPLGEVYKDHYVLLNYALDKTQKDKKKK